MTSCPRGSSCFQAGEALPWPDVLYFQGIGPFIIPRSLTPPPHVSVAVLFWILRSSPHSQVIDTVCAHILADFRGIIFHLLSSYWELNMVQNAEAIFLSNWPQEERQHQPHVSEAESGAQPLPGARAPHPHQSPVGPVLKFKVRVCRFKISTYHPRLSSLRALDSDF